MALYLDALSARFLRPCQSASSSFTLFTGYGAKSLFAGPLHPWLQLVASPERRGMSGLATHCCHGLAKRLVTCLWSWSFDFDDTKHGMTPSTERHVHRKARTHTGTKYVPCVSYRFAPGIQRTSFLPSELAMRQRTKRRSLRRFKYRIASALVWAASEVRSVTPRRSARRTTVRAT